MAPLRATDSMKTWTFVALALTAPGSLLAGCAADGSGSASARPTEEETARIPSPDSLVEAVVVRSDDALSSTADLVYIVPAGGEVPGNDSAEFVADGVDELTVRWVRPRLLEVGYEHARIFRFSNFWESAEVQDYDYVVELRLAPRDTLWQLSEHNRQCRDCGSATEEGR